MVTLYIFIGVVHCSVPSSSVISVENQISYPFDHTRIIAIIKIIIIINCREINSVIIIYVKYLTNCARH